MVAIAEIPALRSQPLYSMAEASRYLNIPTATLRLWTGGVREPAAQRLMPLLQLPRVDERKLSFINLVEAHVLRVLRASHRVPLHKVRAALDYVHHQFDMPHPLARIEFQTDGIDLFIESIGRLINTSQSGQLTLRATVQNLLERVEVDESGIAVRLYPLTPGTVHRLKPVVIDPGIALGQPVLTGTTLSTALIFEHYQQGYTMDELAQMMNCDRTLIEDAILCELLWLSQRS
jgi:uncharacterized protein (DUF433 family)